MKSRKTMIEEHMSNDTQADLYRVALEQVRYEGQLLWQIFGAFLLAQTVFMAFLLQATFTQPLVLTFRVGPFVAALIGLVLCLPWAATYLRSSAYYIFRMAQAREAEPEGWKLLKDVGEAFSEGRQVKVGATPYQVGWLSRNLRTKHSVPVIIVVFVIVYFGILVISGPWW